MTKYLKHIAIVVSLMVIFSTLVAGVIDVKTRVATLERDRQTIEVKLDRFLLRQEAQIEKIRDALHALGVGQAVLQQRIEDLFNARTTARETEVHDA
jgi:hypothetical protein